MNPDCAVGKHAACHGDGWNHETDTAMDCPCTCHDSHAFFSIVHELVAS